MFSTRRCRRSGKGAGEKGQSWAIDRIIGQRLTRRGSFVPLKIAPVGLKLRKIRRLAHGKYFMSYRRTPTLSSFDVGAALESVWQGRHFCLFEG
jgi:hypothetical protein